MKLNLGSIAFNMEVESGGNTPSWGTEMGQGEGYKFSFEDMEDFFPAMVLNSIENCRERVSCPLGKGGKKQDDYKFVLGSRFSKIFVNDKLIPEAEFVLLIVELTNGNNHVGRRSLKYNIHMTLDDQPVNEDCFRKIRKAFALSDDAAWFISEINFRNQDELHFTAHFIDYEKKVSYKTATIRTEAFLKMLDWQKREKEKLVVNYKSAANDNLSFQQITYGAPGTGKSYEINQMTKNAATIRTTFHPDSDYSTFVGAYKPTMVDTPIYGAQGVEVAKEKRITYSFVMQAFLKAYLGAWKKYAEGSDTPAPQFLIIEEINRGNCAQIFGDLFQLLDRNDNGFSSYPIEADADLQKEIERAFKEDDEYKIDTDLQVAGAVKGYTSNYGKSLSEDILEGRVLLLPNNLYIGATMNTSDQSLFPIDSAFKRRWDWKYVRITNGYERDENGKRKLDENGKPIPLGWQIEANGEKFDWWNFVQAINEKIAAATESDDKKLGYFFCKAKDGIIDAETFVGKVIFYLWNDVFKDEDAEIFKLVDGTQPTFDQFYKEDNATGEVIANEEMVSVFLKKLGLVQVEEDFADSVSQKADWVVYVNGAEIRKANQVPYTTIEKYVELHPEMTAQDVIDVWDPFKKYTIRRWIVANKDEIDSMEERYANYSYPIKCNDGSSLWVNKDGWMHHPTNSNRRDTVAEFINAVNESNLGITITEESI